jgi:hypothetical protein
MAVSVDERQAIVEGRADPGFALLPDEIRRWQAYAADHLQPGHALDDAFRDYVRLTHAERGGMRVRSVLADLGGTFAGAVAQLVEGHGLNMRDIRDTERFPRAHAESAQRIRDVRAGGGGLVQPAADFEKVAGVGLVEWRPGAAAVSTRDRRLRGSWHPLLER